MHAHGAHLDLGHPPRVGAEQEDVARRRLDREVLVHRAHGHAVGIEHDAVVAGLGDGAAAGQRGQARAPAGPQAPVDGVVVQVGAAASAPGLDAPAGQRHHLVEVRGAPGRRRARRARVMAHSASTSRSSVAATSATSCWVSTSSGATGGSSRSRRPSRTAASSAVHSTSSSRRRRVEPARRGPVAVVVGPADPLEEGADGARRADLADQLDRADVDAELERRRRHQRAQVAGAQPRLDDAPARRREAAVVRGHEERRVDVAPAGAGLVGGQALGQLMGHPLGHLARVDEHERGAVVPGVLGDAVEDVGHLAAAHDRLELGGGQLDGHLEVAGVAAVDDHGGRPVVVHAREEAGHQRRGAAGWPRARCAGGGRRSRSPARRGARG